MAFGERSDTIYNRHSSERGRCWSQYMSKRRLKRQLKLPQVVMLGTAGTIAAELFVLTGHAAAIAGPATVLAIVLAGLLGAALYRSICRAIFREGVRRMSHRI